MFKISREQMEVFRHGMRARIPERVLESLREQGFEARREAESGDVVCTDERGTQTRMAFSVDGLPERLTLPSGNAVGFEHDAQGRLSAIIHPGAERVEMERDDRGNVTTLRRPSLVSYHLQYDAQDRLILAQYPDGSQTRLSYHPAGPVERVVDRTGALTRHERDDSGRLRASIDPLGRQTLFETDVEGRLEAVVFPDGSRQEYGFDPEHHLATLVLRDGRPVVHELDEENQAVRAISWADGTRSEFEFDGGNLKVARNDWGAIGNSFDSRGNPLSEETPQGRVQYVYDEAGRLVRLTTSHGESLEYEYDGDGRLCRVRAWENDECRMSYGPGGTLKELNYGNGLVETRTYARVGRLEQALVTDLLGRRLGAQRYTYDACERLVSASDSWGNQSRDSFARGFLYDVEGRLRAEFDSLVGQTLHEYAYDAKGNLVDDGGIPIRVGSMDEPCAWGSEPIVYDGNGNMVRLPGPAGELRCSFGGEGMLREVQVGGRTWSFVYDAFGRRVLKTDGWTTWRYGWAGHQLLWEEVDSRPGAAPLRRDYLILPGGTTPLAFRENGRTYWLQTDARGAVIRAFDDLGRVAWRARYDSFGTAHVEVAEVRQPWRLEGQYADAETGLHYNFARYYCPWLKSYLSLDPNWWHVAATHYSYARNDPWNRTDPPARSPP
ncbi:hypothetical protein BON30_26110 [Cystobacter ferrugineus]|uniref:Teneurin-like YD-shell domain-containing protein n=1 Tax=Cystobacter ferrugineus TaxID=83449 RepID=A0A1L9B624_9BACT|nr:hypothetical protein BON30_26110 [Cystobacter ferrugineus]